MASGSCDNRCTSGKEGTCQCSCGGANHGTAKQVYDVLKDGGVASVKGAGLDLDLQEKENGEIQVWNRGNKVQVYRSEKEFTDDLGKLIRAGRVEVTATDAYNRRQVHLTADPERSNREPKLTDKEAQKQIRALGATVTRKDGEYRVNVPGGTEATAYYTDDRADAVGTARAMMNHIREENSRSHKEFSEKAVVNKSGRDVDVHLPSDFQYSRTVPLSGGKNLTVNLAPGGRAEVKREDFIDSEGTKYKYQTEVYSPDGSFAGLHVSRKEPKINRL